MKLMRVKELTPKRDEKCMQIGWDEKSILVNPYHLLGVEVNVHAKQTMITLSGPVRIFVEETMEQVNELFQKCNPTILVNPVN